MEDVVSKLGAPQVAVFDHYVETYGLPVKHYSITEAPALDVYGEAQNASFGQPKIIKMVILQTQGLIDFFASLEFVEETLPLEALTKTSYMIKERDRIIFPMPINMIDTAYSAFEVVRVMHPMPITQYRKIRIAPIRSFVSGVPEIFPIPIETKQAFGRCSLPRLVRMPPIGSRELFGNAQII